MSASSSLQVEHSCRQCGGPVTLDEADRLFTCGFCRVRLYISFQSHPRYIIPPASSADGDTVFVPYWRFRGMSFAFGSREVEDRFLDATFIASGQDFMPRTLGVRAQALRLRFASPTMKSRFLPALEPLEEAVSRIERMSQAVEPPEGQGLHSALVGETVSMVYAPVYVKGRAIYDGVLGRPIANYTLLRAETFEAEEKRRDWSIDFLSALCPDCGWDLEGGRNSVVLLCRNCDAAWRVSGKGFARQEFSVAPEGGKDLLYIPFWRLGMEVEGLEASSYADLVRLANLPKAPRAEWEARPLHFWSPAFNIHPRLYLRLARQLTILQPDAAPGGRLSGLSLYPATVSALDAAGGVKATLAALSKVKRRTLPRISGARIRLRDSALVYLPFAPNANDLVQTRYRFGISRNSLRALK